MIAPRFDDTTEAIATPEIERRRIAADLEARARAIEDTNGSHGDWLAQRLYTELPTLPIGGAVQADPRTIAVLAYREIASLITAEINAGRSSSDAPTRTPETPQAPEDPHPGTTLPPEATETITAAHRDQLIAADLNARAWCQHLAEDLARHLNTSPHPDAATWSEVLAWYAKRIKGGHLSILMHADFERRFGGPVAWTSLNSATTGTDPSEFAAAVWCALADAGHTAAIDSPTGDGYEIEPLPGPPLAILVTVVHSLPLTFTEQRKILERWGNALQAAGYHVLPITTDVTPNGLYVTRPTSEGDGTDVLANARYLATAWRGAAMQHGNTADRHQHAIWRTVGHVCASFLATLNGADPKALLP
ncbi:hypothetical protein [Sphaerisporangium sp. NPDC051011]|uniref:hypothetical protein n=1 Tax=Sphaerisporangium sp. NPDC051011 TaxID=3155792 RepID=UPI0033C2997E